MSLFTKKALSKVALAGFTLTALLLTTGCDEAPTPTADGQDNLVMTTIALDTLNNVFFTPLINSDILDSAQKSCLEARDKDLGRMELQRFYKTQFSAAELKELEDFYTSKVGKKMLAYGNEQSLLISGEKVSRPMSAPSEEELAEIKAFMQSPAANKYMKISSAEGDGSTMGVLNSPINAEFKRCNINLDMSEFM